MIYKIFVDGRLKSELKIRDLAIEITKVYLGTYWEREVKIIALPDDPRGGKNERSSKIHSAIEECLPVAADRDPIAERNPSR